MAEYCVQGPSALGQGPQNDPMFGSKRRDPIENFKAINIGAEFFTHTLQRIFPVDCLKDCDVMTVVGKLKRLEKDTYEILKKPHHR